MREEVNLVLMRGGENKIFSYILLEISSDVCSDFLDFGGCQHIGPQKVTD